MHRLLVLSSVLVVLATGPPGAASSDQPREITSLLGTPLNAPVPQDAARMEAQLAQALAAWEQNRDDADALIWVGRRTAYLGR